MNGEIWKPIPGYEGLYEVSSTGRVKSLTRNINGRTYTGRMLKLVADRNGYIRVKICRKRIIERLLVHRIVAIAFLPNPENKPIVDHIDGNPQNNNAKNLRWATQKENQNNPVSLCRFRQAKAGKFIPDWIRQKGNASARKAIVMLDNNGNELATFASLTQAQKKTKIAASSISAVCKNKRPSAGGYKWKYKNN